VDPAHLLQAQFSHWIRTEDLIIFFSNFIGPARAAGDS